MTTRKRQKRQESTAEEYSLGVARAKEAEAMTMVQDDDLFVLDRGGSKTAKRKLAVQQQQVSTGVPVSRTERTLVRKVVQRGVTEKASSSGKGPSAVADIWGDDSTPASKGNGKLVSVGAAKAKRLVVRPGQSYNPAKSDHQDLLAEALALELQKKEKDARAAGKEDLLTVPAPAPEDLSRFGGASDSEDDGSDYSGDEEGDENQVGSRRSRRKGSKLTKAQRNKMRSRKAKSFEELKQKQEAKLLKEIDDSSKILSALEQKELRSQRKKELLELQKAEAARDASRLTYAEAGAVPLTDELRGSLRLVTSKGLLVADKVNEMRNNGQLTKRDRKRKHFETPHGSEKVVWIPKYKY